MNLLFSTETEFSLVDIPHILSNVIISHKSHKTLDKYITLGAHVLMETFHKPSTQVLVVHMLRVDLVVVIALNT